MSKHDELARSLGSLVLGASLVLLAACGGGGGEQTSEAGGATADATTQETAHDHPAPGGDGVSIAGVTIDVPAGWEDLGPDGMRQAQFRLAAVDGDTEAAEVNVFYFGPASGGGVEANLQRWIGQIQDGTEPERATFTADGMNGHIVSLDGAYKAGGMRPMGGDGEVKPGYRLVGVVLEGPQGSVFYKLTGPKATATAMEQDLLTAVKAARARR